MMNSFIANYNKIFADYNILEFNYQWFKWGGLFHEKLPLFSVKRHRGIFLQIVRHFYFLFRYFSTNSRKIVKNDVVAFYETSNQKKVIIDVCEHIKEFKQIRLLVLDCYSKSIKSEDTVLVTFNILDVVLGFIYGLINSFNIIRKLSNIDNRLCKNQLSDFLSAYAWTSYFLRILLASRPSCVILANDHNPSNRSLIAVCNILNIKTIYIQHASITRFMPPICCDLNFLYGSATKDLYEEIRKIERNPSYFIKDHYEIILTGVQKNSYNTFSVVNNSKNAIGIAVNQDDPIQSVKNLIDKLSINSKSRIILRFHPSQEKESIKVLYNTFRHYDNVLISSPIEMNLGEFFSKVKLVIAGNSGILLDAIINNLPTFYFKFDTASFDDFYYFVKYRLTTEINVEEIIKIDFDNFNNVDARDILYFDNSFNNTFSFKESKFIANKIFNTYLNKK